MFRDFKDKKIFSILCIITLVLFTIPTVVISAEGINYVSRSDWKADESLSLNSDQKYGLADKIYVTGITSQDTQSRIDTESWVKGLYYFFATKTQLKDMPFNYLIGWDGTLYEGKALEKDLVAPIENKNALLIGYLSNYDNTEMTPLSKNALEKLLTDLLKKNDISKDNIQTKDWEIKPTDNLQKTYIELSSFEKSALIDKSLQEIKDKLEYNFSSIVRSYKSELINTVYEKELKIDEIYDVTLKVKNTGDTNWYKNSPAEITIAKKEDNISEFFVQDNWLSNSQTSAMTVEMVKTQEETELKFQISTPFTADGSFSETFVLKMASGETVENSEFNIEVNVSTEGLQIVEVLSTPTGFLNIRENPTLGGKLITQVVPGERFILLASQSGWGKIQLKNGEEGWATKQYMRVL